MQTSISEILHLSRQTSCDPTTLRLQKPKNLCRTTGRASTIGASPSWGAIYGARGRSPVPVSRLQCAPSPSPPQSVLEFFVLDRSSSMSSSQESQPSSRQSTSDPPQQDAITLFDLHLRFLSESYLSFFLERYARKSSSNQAYLRHCVTCSRRIEEH